MKHWKWIASTGLVAVLAIAYVTADTQELRGNDGPRARGPVGPIFQLFDADHDGVVTRAELAQADAAFDTLDRNGDGVLSEADFRRSPRGRHAGGMLAAGIAKAADVDQSGDVTEAEWQNLVASIETDSDGAIVPESLHAVLGIERPVREDRGDRRMPTAADLNELFTKLDRDGNGVLDESEQRFERRHARFAPGGPEGLRGPGPRGPMVMADTDSSGDVSAAEWQALFDQLDANGDGTLTVDELQAAHAGRGMRREARGSRQR